MPHGAGRTTTKEAGRGSTGKVLWVKAQRFLPGTGDRTQQGGAEWPEVTRTAHCAPF